MKAFLCLGDESEIVGILPIVQHEFETGGEKPVLIIQAGASLDIPFAHVQSPPASHRDFKDVLALAKRDFNDVVAFPSRNDGGVQHRHPSHQFDQWDRAGLIHLWNKIPLTLPRTSAVLMFDHPTILLADDPSTPFHKELRKFVSDSFPRHKILYLSEEKGSEISDVLALYDAADLIICAETIHLQLSRATKTPVIAIANDQPTPWHGSAPSKRFAYFTHYSQFEKNKSALLAAANNAIYAPGLKPEEPLVVMVYVHFPGEDGSAEFTKRFVNSYLQFHPGISHRTIVVCQGQKPPDEIKALLKQLPNCSFFIHDDSGWDIGAFIEVSRIVSEDMMVCMGGNSHVQKAGWMKRMVEIWKKHGPGFYGSLSTYEISPHINTSGFWCSPELLGEYPLRVRTKKERYDFEHGKNAIWKYCLKNNIKVMLGTWDGEYEWQDWRKPVNVYRSGDQSNCLTLFRHSDRFEVASPEMKVRMKELADTITDVDFLERVAA